MHQRRKATRMHYIYIYFFWQKSSINNCKDSSHFHSRQVSDTISECYDELLNSSSWKQSSPTRAGKPVHVTIQLLGNVMIFLTPINLLSSIAISVLQPEWVYFSSFYRHIATLLSLPFSLLSEKLHNSCPHLLYYSGIIQHILTSNVFGWSQFLV